ncbi:single-stranded-DNA-specific exonuclease RecJ [Luteimonas sp. e5]
MAVAGMTPRIVRRQVETEGEWPASLPPLLRRIFAARGALDLDSAQPRLATLPPPDDLAGVDAACHLLADAIARDARIMVVADFDCDGATGCAVAMRGLAMLGARNLGFAVPDRQRHGYGLSPALVEELAAQSPDLLLTVDHGIACLRGVAAARQRGWQVVVSDHHLPGEELPPADAIVNPNQPGCAFPSKALAGVGVVFYLLLALRAHLRGQGSAVAATADLSTLLDLVAVGSVADMVPMDVANRALVGAGLRRIRNGQACAGINALIDVSGRRRETLGTADIGFAIAPRINAAGRLEDMTLGIACLLSDAPETAGELAAMLDGINRERRGLQDDMLEDAERIVAGLELGTATSRPALCLHQPHWHPGVVGLVASRLKDRLHRPVIAFAPSEPGSDELRGSARSIPGFHVRDALARVDALHPGLITRFGGHAMAAGLSLPVARLAAFDAAFLACAEAALQPHQLQQEILSDGELAADEFDIRYALLLRDAAAWGQHFPEPVFDGEFELLSWRPVGQNHLKLELVAHGRRLNAIQFGGWQGEEPPARLHIAYRLVPDDWRGGDAVQLIVLHRQAA